MVRSLNELIIRRGANDALYVADRNGNVYAALLHDRDMWCVTGGSLADVRAEYLSKDLALNKLWLAVESAMGLQD